MSVGDRFKRMMGDLSDKAREMGQPAVNRTAKPAPDRPAGLPVSGRAPEQAQAKPQSPPPDRPASDAAPGPGPEQATSKPEGGTPEQSTAKHDGKPTESSQAGKTKASIPQSKLFDQLAEPVSDPDSEPAARRTLRQKLIGSAGRVSALLRGLKVPDARRIPRPLRITAAWLVVILSILFLVGAGMELAASGRIERGVKVDGLDVGGMTREQARKAIEGRVNPLKDDLQMRFEGKEYKIKLDSIDFRIDEEGMIQDAFETGKGSAGLVRVTRRLLGMRSTENIPVKVAVNKDWLNNRVLALGRKIDREPVSARISVSSGSPEIVPSKNGVKTRVRDTVNAVIKILPGATRQVDVIADSLKPEVVEADVSKIVWIRQKQFKLFLFDRTEEINSFTIAVGMPQYPTPNGRFHITYKEKNPTWLPTSEWAKDKQGIPQPPGPGNPLGGYWMDIGNGIGIHATPFPKSLGEQASHGCIRMREEDAGTLFNAVKVGTPVFITD